LDPHRRSHGLGPDVLRRGCVLAPGFDQSHKFAKTVPDNLLKSQVSDIILRIRAILITNVNRHGERRNLLSSS
jgi:hypothetical protein